MNEASVRRETYRLLRRLYYTPHRLRDAILCPRCNTKVIPMTSGRPDILANSTYGPGVYVEVKALNLRIHKSFAFNNITPEQRRYFDFRIEEGFRCYLALGTVNTPRQGRETGRQLWIVDWEDWLDTEATLRPYQESIPLTAGKGFSKILQELKLDLCSLCYPFECHREHGMWHIPGTHSLWQDGAPPGEKEL